MSRILEKLYSDGQGISHTDFNDSERWNTAAINDGVIGPAAGFFDPTSLGPRTDALHVREVGS